MTDSELKRAVESTLHEEVRFRGLDIHVDVQNGEVSLTGQVDELRDKRLAVNLVRRMREVGRVQDKLRLATVSDLDDKRVVQHVQDGLMQDPNVQRFAVRVNAENGLVTLEGEVDSLEAKRLIGLIAWWVPGTADVVNALNVVPPQEDSDDDLHDSIRQAFEKDVLVNADQIDSSVKDGVITLIGTVASEEERLAAEHDCYYVLGVQHVVNRLEVMPR
ncbi:MAG TPA: BON domain-containing protein [Oscillatoriaceae cyanobacterium]